MSFPLTNMLLARAKGLIVSNDDVLDYFDNRTTQSATITGSSEYLTGIYQEPDVGTYSGDINDLTEQQITDISNGDVYGSIAWSTLEKAWILENLDTTSTSGIKRYNFTFTSYDSGVLNIPVANSGARGDWGSLTQAIFDGDELPPDFVPGSLPILQGSTQFIYDSILNGGGPGQTDWINPTSGLAENWFKSVGTGTNSIVTGNGFNGNAQRTDSTTASAFKIQNSIRFDNPLTGFIRLKNRSDVEIDVSVQIYDENDLSLGTPFIETIPVNTGNAIETLIPYEIDLGTYPTAKYVGVIGFSIDEIGYFEIDEVIFIESFGVADWVDSDSDNVPNDWTNTTFGTTTIETLTAATFFKKAVKLTLSGVGVNGLSSNIEVDLDSNENYLISFRYKGAGLEVALGGAIYHSVPTNTGDAEIYQVQLTSSLSLFTPQFRTLLDGGDFTVDEVEIIQI